MNSKKYKRKQSTNKMIDKIKSIKGTVPKIVFRAKNIVVTLKNKSQLRRWMDIYPEGTYQVNY
tara:strand:+ start:735 stop:923 length:189 start_codon:yes stop_codon:yes gene_type:complete